MERIKRTLDRNILDVVGELELLKYAISIMEMEDSVLTAGGKKLPSKEELVNNIKGHYDGVLAKLKVLDLELNERITKETQFIAVVTAVFTDDHKIPFAQIFEWNSDLESYTLSTRGPNDPQSIASIHKRLRRWKENVFSDA